MALSSGNDFDRVARLGEKLADAKQALLYRKITMADDALNIIHGLHQLRVVAGLPIEVIEHALDRLEFPNPLGIGRRYFDKAERISDLSQECVDPGVHLVTVPSARRNSN